MKNALHKGLVAIAQEILDAQNEISLGHLKELSRDLYEELVLAAHQEEFATDHRPSSPVVELSTEQIKDIVAQMPAEAEQVDELIGEIVDGPVRTAPASDPMEHYRQTIVFEPKESAPEPAPEAEEVPQEGPSVHGLHRNKQPKTRNNQTGRLIIGLNDRLVFVKQLFLDDVEGYNRVVSQINTFSSYQEAHDFLTQQVIPEYANWIDKDAIVERFLSLVAQRFNN